VQREQLQVKLAGQTHTFKKLGSVGKWEYDLKWPVKSGKSMDHPMDFKGTPFSGKPRSTIWTTFSIGETQDCSSRKRVIYLEDHSCNGALGSIVVTP
jgi:hypothetical protein